MQTRTVLLLTLICNSLLFAAGARRFHEGNSLTGPMLNSPPRMLHSMAADAGFVDDFQDSGTYAGIPIDLAWRDHSAAYIQALSNGAPFDYVVIQPFRHMIANRATWFTKEVIGAESLCKAALQFNPDTTIMVYYTWVTWNTNDPYSVWREWMQDCITNYFEYFTDVLQQALPGTPIFTIPTTAALVTLGDKIEHGDVPGIGNISNLYYDLSSGSQVHLDANGYYLSALLHVPSYYGVNPVGFSTNYEIYAHFAAPNQQRPVTLNAVQATNFQQVAWHILTNFPRTTIAQLPRHKANTNRPSAPGSVMLSAISNGTATVSWSAATDDVAVTYYSVSLDGNWRATVYGLSYELDGLTNPPHTVSVRAWDAEYNFSETRAFVPEPAISLATAIVLRLLTRQ